MKKRSLIALLTIMVLVILDSRCAADSAREALSLCAKALIPALFPLFVLCGLLVPGLAGLKIPGLARLLGFPQRGEGFFLLGFAGGYPLGAACIAQAVERNGLDLRDSERMVGLCSLCGPGFLFGVVASLFSLELAAALFLLQLEAALITAAVWPMPSSNQCSIISKPVSLPAAVNRAVSSMASVCAWVTLAAVAAGFLGRWIFPFLPEPLPVVLTGLMELTNGLFALQSIDGELPFLLCSLFISFGGVSVHLQIAGQVMPVGIRMRQCILQKCVHAFLTTALTFCWLRLGGLAFWIIPAALIAKIAVEIPGGMVYNDPRKEGI